MTIDTRSLWARLADRFDGLTEDEVIANYNASPFDPDKHPVLSIPFSGGFDLALRDDAELIAWQWTNSGYLDDSYDGYAKTRTELGIAIGATEDEITAHLVALADDVLGELSDAVGAEIEIGRDFDREDFLRDLTNDWDAHVFDLDGEYDDWDGYLAAVADAVEEAHRLRDDSRDVSQIADEDVDTDDYRGTLI